MFGNWVKICFLSFLISTPSSANAELVWDNKLVEVAVKVGEKEARGTFSFVNTGLRSVIIQDLRSCCTCLVGTTKEDEILPGKRGEIAFVFKLQGRVGKQQRQLLVVHNDPVEPRTVLTILVNIE